MYASISVACACETACLAAGGYIDETVSYAIPLLAAIGRMYWWYHWAGDCIVGALLGKLCVYAVLVMMGGYGNLQVVHWAVGLVVFVAALKLTSTSKTKKEKQETENKTD